MKKFIIIYRAPPSASKEMHKKDPEEMKKGMAKWMEWAKNCGDSLIDLGSPLGNTHTVTSSGAERNKDDTGGYSIMQAESMEDVIKLIEEHPHLSWNEGCSIDVNECMPMPK
jgi:hypothetical protein